MIGRVLRRLGRAAPPAAGGAAQGADPDGDEEGAGVSTEGPGGSVRLCGREDLAAGQARCFDVAGRKVALARVGDEFFAIDDTCSHADYSLSEGDVDIDECAVECPAHGSLFDLRTGDALTLPAIAPVAAHDLAVSDEGVFVTLRSAGN